MRLPQPLLESLFFVFSSQEELVKALGEFASTAVVEEIDRVSALGLPPIVSDLALSTMVGINPGLIWSFINRAPRHYRNFTIPKGRGVRHIDAPRVALKTIQKWVSLHLQRRFVPPDHVCGFVPNRSHILAAKRHLGATWIYSVDIENFFPTTPIELVTIALREVGYSDVSSRLIASLCCLRGHLAQGSPASPVLSNMAFASVDAALVEVARLYQITVTRYADDVVFSGRTQFPEKLRDDVANIFAETHWRIANLKTEFAVAPQRLKVHGLLVHGNSVRLTKGYRNKLRAYRHLLAINRIRQSEASRIRGHIAYGDYVARESEFDKIGPE